MPIASKPFYFSMTDIQKMKSAEYYSLTVVQLIYGFSNTKKKDGDNLNRLKAALSCFFLIEQIDKPFDSRYDTFYATILEYGKWVTRPVYETSR